MWNILKIKSCNICAFKDFEFAPLQNKTTLIFGNNLDDTSQQSNGSGKSALIEMVALGILGEPLRKVNTSEIINDAEDEAFVSLELENKAIGVLFTINRTIRRKGSQIVECEFHDINTHKEVLKDKWIHPSVNDYNAFILSELGLTKEDIYTNFILSKHKYSPFLTAPDKQKKELINRFSNGHLVDKSLDEITEDITPKCDKLTALNSQISNLNGRISALEEQIIEVQQNTENSKQERASRIARLKEDILLKTSSANSLKRKLSGLKGEIEDFDDIYKKLEEIEDECSETNQDFSVIQAKVGELFDKQEIPQISDYSSIAENMLKESNKLMSQKVELDIKLDNLSNRLLDVENELALAEKSHHKFEGEYTEEKEKLNEEGANLKKEIGEISKVLSSLYDDGVKISHDISQAKALLASSISCPKCHHEFVLNKDVDVEKTKLLLTEKQSEKNTLDSEIEKTIEKRRSLEKNGEEINSRFGELQNSRKAVQEKVEEQRTILQNIKQSIFSTQSSSDRIKKEATKLKNQLEDLQDELFDEAHSNVKKEHNSLKKEIENTELSLERIDGQIESYKLSIKDLENQKDDNMVVESFKKSIAQNKSELEEKENEYKHVLSQINELKEQSEYFQKFKTYLANTKIDALAYTTNQYLEEIGSDIRVSFSGYTILKSGKVRDKISISLLRNGIECGSYGKFSEGEKARVNLANILAMQKLTNTSCEDGKGLNFLVLDEILEATDEAGLSSMFKALNNIHLTTMVVSHGNIAENYPHKLIINKHNGISYLE